ncbi:MAG: hypothetical protein MZU97_06335 [Bacillus subtilis]|nr:hypothetical protein [Bacillus subtilis]
MIADFSNLPAAPTFADVSAIGRLAVDEFMKRRRGRGLPGLHRLRQHGAPGHNGQETAAAGT